MADSIDEYILAHHRSMSQREIAVKLGIDKSTVSRRLAAMRKAGAVDDAAAKAAKDDVQRAKDRLQGCALSRADRLAALAELKDLLHEEIKLSGGASMARVASEYRACMEQMETLTVELDLAANAVAKMTADDVVLLKVQVARESMGLCDPDTADAIVDAVLSALDNDGLIKCSMLARLQAAHMQTKRLAIEREMAKQAEASDYD